MNRPVEVIIVNFNAGDAILSCVSSVLEAGDGSRVRIVDNASTDGSVERIEAEFADRGRLEVIRNRKNPGFAKAVNQAARSGGAEFLLILNPDCELHPGALDLLIMALEADAAAALAAPRVVDGNGKIQRSTLRRFPDPWRSLMSATGLWRLGRRMPRFRGVNQPEENLPSDNAAVEAVSGACMLVRKSAFDEAGGMDEAYGLHFEDLDLMYRLQQRGYRCLLVPAATVMHTQGVSSRSRPFWVHRQKHLGMQRFFGKFQAAGHPLPVRLLVLAGIWLHFVATLPLVAWRKLTCR